MDFIKNQLNNPQTLYILILVTLILYFCFSKVKESFTSPSTANSRYHQSGGQASESDLDTEYSDLRKPIELDDLNQTPSPSMSTNGPQNGRSSQVAKDVEVVNEADIMATSTTRSPDPPAAGGPCPSTCLKDEDCNIVFGRGKNKCMNNKCECAEGAGTFCHLRPNYYKDLEEMTPAQIVKFKRKAKLEKMTLQDYRNWLSLFLHDQENLPRRHKENFNRLQQAQPIYDIPLEDPVEEFFASQGAVRDRVCLDIPNAEVDSPLNWKLNTTLNNAGIMNVKGETERPLMYSRYFKQDPLAKANMEKTKPGQQVKARDWFVNNVNWMFYDINRNEAYKDPNQNRFMNIIENQRVTPEANFRPQRLLSDAHANREKKVPEPRLDPNSVNAGHFAFMGQ